MTAKKLRRAYARKILRASRKFGWNLSYGDALWWAKRCVVVYERWEGGCMAKGCGPAPTLVFDSYGSERGARIWAALDAAGAAEWGSCHLHRYCYLDWDCDVLAFFEAMD